MDKATVCQGVSSIYQPTQAASLFKQTSQRLFGRSHPDGAILRRNSKISAVAAKRDYSGDRILTVLSYDAIPAIKNPEFVSASEAKLKDDSPVIGVSFNGESHAYSIYLLNGYEIVNDEVGGVKIATTW